MQLDYSVKVGYTGSCQGAHYPRCDIVTMFEVLEHIPDPRPTLQTVHRQLKTGAWFLGSVPGQAFHRLKVWPRGHLEFRAALFPLHWIRGITFTTIQRLA